MRNEIILFDNHYFSMEAFCCFLDSNGSSKTYDYRFTSDYDELVELISKRATIAIINLCGISVNDALELPDKLLAINPSLKIIILSSNPEVKIIKKFFEKGVKSFLTKTADSKEFVYALKEVLAGKVYLTEDTKNELYNFICNVGQIEEHDPSRLEELTVREKEVLHHICEGLRTREIADALFISPHTVESHRRNIMQKLDVRSSSMLVKFAMSNNLVH